MTRDLSKIRSLYSAEIRSTQDLQVKYHEDTKALIKSFDLLFQDKQRTEVVTNPELDNSNQNSENSGKSEPSNPKADKEVKMTKSPPSPKCKERQNFAWNPIYMCKGDILEVDEDTSIAHCVGNDLRISDGLASHIKEKFNLSEAIEQQRGAHNGVGSIIKVKHKNRFILNLVTKQSSTETQPKWKDFKRTIKALPQKWIDLGIKKLCIPRLGSGLDNID